MLADIRAYYESILSFTEICGYQTDLVVALAEKQKMRTITLPWIIGYCSKSKVASIDLNRYKLEALLLTSDVEEINCAVTNSLFSSDCHIREHMADIIGEKRLHVAGNAFVTWYQQERKRFPSKRYGELPETAILHNFFTLEELRLGLCRFLRQSPGRSAKCSSRQAETS